ncbi:hypothetical protein SAMN05216174_106319 [Actinokineospora iranica]|uniref:Uncharacterized protein n=1 Tax=Actinokineospora iranica TaxID=1271860 RepID=A0A1G6RFB5_9PSEU|nr:hypothetical protein SAMN05216174_106319 [Actinokineospora iranica]
MTSTESIMRVLWDELVRQGRWTFYLFGERGSPYAQGAVSTWPHVQDVLIVWDESDAIAYRSPRVEGSEFAPTHVLRDYVYRGPTTWTLRWILACAPPTDTLLPLDAVPPGFPMPRSRLRPARIFPPGVKAGEVQA